MAPSLQGRLEETTDEKVSDATQTAFATPLSVTSSMRVWFGLLSGAASLAGCMDIFYYFLPSLQFLLWILWPKTLKGIFL